MKRYFICINGKTSLAGRNHWKRWTRKQAKKITDKAIAMGADFHTTWFAKG